jgi:hypothetical protein
MSYAISQSRFINHFINHAMSHGARHLQQQFLSQQIAALQQSFLHAISAVFISPFQSRRPADHAPVHSPAPEPEPHDPSKILSTDQFVPRLNPGNRSTALLARFV